MTTKHLCILVTASIAAVLLCAGAAEAESDILMIPAAAFSADGSAEDDYISYGDHLYSLNSTSQYLHAWVKLPNRATITNVDMMTRDDSTATITGYLKRVKFGADGTAETLLTFTSPGNIGCSTSGLCHDMESLLEIEVDSANYIYWFDIFVPYAPGRTPLADYLDFHAVRIMYDYDDLIFADNFESSDTVMWSSETSSKSGVLAGALLQDAAPIAAAEPTDAELLARFSSNLYIEDPLAQEAMENALLGKAGYGSPYVIPGPAFKTQGYIGYDGYYFSESWGIVYARPGEDDGAVMYAPVNLPDGAEISFYMAFFVDSVRSGVSDDIRFWLSRMDSTDVIPTDDMVYETSSGRDTNIRTISVSSGSMETAVPGSTTVNNARYSYWATIDVGPYDTSPPDPYGDEEWWHKVYAIVILYTMP